MYKLLLVDDETATREGILEGICWEKLGISEVVSEKNGALAYEKAEQFVPDILLTDIKMPRMNGIDLSHHIRELNPNCSILIMSGYSEIDYLKSAIRLNAINFVDKPVELTDLEQWILKSVEAQNAIRKHQLFLRDEISSKLAYQSMAEQSPLPLIQELYPEMTETSVCTTLLLKVFPPDFGQNSISGDLPKVMQNCTDTLDNKKIKYAVRISECDILTFYLFDWDSKDIVTGARQLYNLFQESCPNTELFLAVGAPNPLPNCYLSSKSAEDVLIKIFFSREKRLLFATDNAKTIYKEILPSEVDYKLFSQILRQGDFDGAVIFIRK